MNPLAGTGSLIPIICFLLLTPGSPSSISWSPIGPGGGGWIPSITVVNDASHTVYAACDVGGIYKSTDQGRTWQIKNNGLTTYYVQNIAYDPATPSTLYAATRGGVFKSTNGGERWQGKRAGFPDESLYHFSAPVGDIVVDPQAPNIVYAGIGVPRAAYEPGNFYWQECEVKGSIYKSSDFGEHWTRIYNTGIPTDAKIYSIAIDPGDSSILFAATSEGVYKSHDHGAAWTAKNNGLPDHLRAMGLVINPADTNTLYVTMWAQPGSATWQGGVYKSTDGGSNWFAINTGLGVDGNLQVRKIAIDPNNPSILYAGIEAKHIEPDNGDEPTTLQGGLFKSTNAGASWTRIDTSLPQLSVWDIEVAAGDSQTIYSAVSSEYDHSREIDYYGGVYKSSDGGLTWTQMINGFGSKENLDILSIAISPAGSNILYAVTSDAPFHDNSSGRGIFTSIDGGEHWNPVNNGLSVLNFNSITIDPSNPSLLYAGSDGNGIFKGIDPAPTLCK